MIKLTPEQEDALIEIGNIGMSKAAKQLSVLLNSAIKITIPKISLMDVDEIVKEDLIDQTQTYILVSQHLSADMEGCAALVFRRQLANRLTMTVINHAPEFNTQEARACEQDAMLEIGNIIISSCISVIAKMFSNFVNLDFPAYSEGKLILLLNNLMNTLRKSHKNMIAITTKLETQNDNLSAHLFLILTTESIVVLLNEVRKLING